ncbi:NUDIX domain-containing protein [Peristeroidobacter soli]|jgi:phosphatase NudJ|uniref:NUDIX domain-containing protein n=1 Tax=Peristeroidobacter soli TaxID=2497877 RepID=UPI001300413F|nr:NUDIX domain-containing protein [Peristeroidobacter soli]
MTLVVATVVLVRGKVLLVQENLPGEPWYLPAGRVEPGEQLLAAARRECREEAGLHIEPTNLLAIEQRWRGTKPWTRFVFRGELVGDGTPKSVADEHTQAAAWWPVEQLHELNLRGEDVLNLVALDATEGASTRLLKAT